MQKRHTPLTNRTMFALAALVVSPMAHGQQGLVDQELIRRQEQVRSADTLLLEGRKAYAEADYATAVQKYRTALDTLPYGSATSDRRAVLKQHLEDGSVALSQQYRRVGKYTEARELLNDVESADPGNPAARKGLEFLDDPIRTNPSNSYENSQNVDKVRRHLYKGNGYYDLGLYDQAEEEFKNVIRIDPYNSAARRWLEKCAAIKSEYYRAAYDQTRARMLMEVDKAWELAVPPLNANEGPLITTEVETSRSVTIAAKLQQINIPVVDFNNTTVEEASDFLRIRSIELDVGTLDEKSKGVNFVVRKPKVVGGASDEGLDTEGGILGGAVDPSAVTIDKLYLTNVPLQVALQYICDKAKLRYKVDEYAVTLLPLTDDTTDDIVTRRWTVPPTFENFLDSGGGEGGATGDADPFADDDAGGGKGIEARKPIKQLLADQGVSFIEGTSASLLTGSGTLVVRNTPTQLELIDAIVQASLKDTPRQIRVLTKFVEVSQENSEELGFDWIATPFGVGSNYFLGGGTVGSGAARTNADFISPVARTTIPGIPASQNQEVSGIATAGLRSGAAAVNRNSIDAILNNPQRTAQATRVAPGILSMTGLFDSGQIQMIMRGLSQKKGADIMTAPSVVARPGQNATIEIIREFIYPTEYEPPELPNQVGGGFGGGTTVGLGSSGGSFPVTPATPTSFDTKKTGVTLEVEPQVGANDNVIDLRFSPTIVEFEGFVNYGSPITSPASDALGNPVQIVITENRIEMPVFSVRRVTTGLTIYDGYTVAVGGLMREDVQSVEDKVPILGDLPFVGRLFQSKAENHIKSNLIIFVTAEIIDATGRKINTNQAAASGAPVSPNMLPGLPDQ